MSTVKSPTVQIEFDLPRDVLFAMKSFGRPDVIRQKVRTALALLLFRENAVSLGKAADVAEMSYAQFLDVLHSHGIAAYECTEQECAWDDEGVNAYRQAVAERQ